MMDSVPPLERRPQHLDLKKGARKAQDRKEQEGEAELKEEEEQEEDADDEMHIYNNEEGDLAFQLLG